MNPGVSIAAIDALLPQTQCTKCGYPSCLDYARGIAQGTSDINRCPPGGMHSINALADFLIGVEKGEAAQPDFRCALQTQKVCDGVIESAKSGQWCEISS